MTFEESTRLVQAAITSISFPSSLERLRAMGSKWQKMIGRDWATDMDVLMDFPVGKQITWIAPKWLTASDILFFYHTKSATSLIQRLQSEATRVIRGGADPSEGLSRNDVNALKDILDRQSALAQRYSGSIFGFAVVSGRPVRYHDEDKHFKGTIYAPLGEVHVFPSPLFDFTDIIRIGQNTTTPVFGQEFEKLKERAAAHNQLPDILVQTESGSLSFRNVDSMNWPDVCCNREAKFVDEAQIRAYLIDYLLSEVKDDRSPLLPECDCFRDGLRTGTVDYFISVSDRWVPVEAKLNVLVEENVSSQIEKYAHIQSFQPTKGAHKGHLFKIGDLSMVLVVDQSGIYFTEEGRFVDCDAQNPKFRREDINHQSMSEIRESIISFLGR
jgi:hypothetical protein